jgi:hypothetical protein
LGLYRLRGSSEGVVYIGQGAIRKRLIAHHRKTLDPSSLKPQDVILCENGPLEFSAVEGEWESHQRLELENDLIAAHIFEMGTVPPAQFIA